MKKKKLPLAIFTFLVCEAIFTYYFALMDSMLRKQVLTSHNFLYLIKYLYHSPKSLQLFGIIFALGIFVALIALTWNNETYKSKQYQVTDNISIPMPAGEGQCGTSWWLSQKDYDKAFASYEFDENILKEWELIKLDDIKEELERIEREEGKKENE